VGEAVHPGDDPGGVLAQPVEDDPQGRLARLVGVAHDAQGALGRGERLVAGHEGEALRLLSQQHGRETTVAQADLAQIGHRAGHAKGL